MLFTLMIFSKGIYNKSRRDGRGQVCPEFRAHEMQTHLSSSLPPPSASQKSQTRMDKTSLDANNNVQPRCPKKQFENGSCFAPTATRTATKMEELRDPISVTLGWAAPKICNLQQQGNLSIKLKLHPLLLALYLLRARTRTINYSIMAKFARVRFWKGAGCFENKCSQICTVVRLVDAPHFSFQETQKLFLPFYVHGIIQFQLYR